ncbi:MAG: 4-vinyl reductase [Candidatus Micrarchaeota archaeon]
MNAPFSIVPLEVLSGLALISDENANKAVYSAVKSHVRDSLLQSFQLTPPLLKAVSFLEEYFTASGWGKLSHVQIDETNHRAIMVVDENPVAISLQGKSAKPVDHVYRGVLAGMFSKLFGVDVDCVEHQCACQGRKTCEFVIQPQAEFDFAKTEPREQLSLKD